MNIIFEGIDNSGKSTLVNAVANETQWPVGPKEGKPINFDSVIDKIERYLLFDKHLFDRHPVISQSIYGPLRDDPHVPPALTEAFYQQKPLIVYCRVVDKRLVGHLPSATDDLDHLKALSENYYELLQKYDRWAIRYARIFYTDYAQTRQVIAMLKGVISECR